MVDLTRGALTRHAYMSLLDPDFRRRLKATAPEGHHPILVAMREDLVHNLLDQVRAVGGCANVVVPLLNGFVVVVLDAVAPDEHEALGGAPLLSNCTVGVLLSRLEVDVPEGEPVTYGFVLDGEDSASAERGTAKLVALGT